MPENTLDENGDFSFVTSEIATSILKKTFSSDNSFLNWQVLTGRFQIGSDFSQEQVDYDAYPQNLVNWGAW